MMEQLTQNLDHDEKIKRPQINPTWVIAIALVVIAAVLVFVFAIPTAQTGWSNYSASRSADYEASEAIRTLESSKPYKELLLVFYEGPRMSEGSDAKLEPIKEVSAAEVPWDKEGGIHSMGNAFKKARDRNLETKILLQRIHLYDYGSPKKLPKPKETFENAYFLLYKEDSGWKVGGSIALLEQERQPRSS